jgi:hypothetical protein
LVVTPCVLVAPWVPEGPVLEAALESSGASSLEPPLQATTETRSIDKTAETWSRIGVA